MTKSCENEQNRRTGLQMSGEEQNSVSADEQSTSVFEMQMLEQCFGLKEKDIRTYSPLTLAYLGDAVYELAIRTVLVKKGNCPVNHLHRQASSLVKASAQSQIMEIIEEKLTPEEHDVYRRGRNAHSPTMAKHATMADYRRATGFEALVGYLYLKEEYGRILMLIRMGIKKDKI